MSTDSLHNPSMYQALTAIVVIIIIILSPDTISAIIAIGLVIAFYMAATRVNAASGHTPGHALGHTPDPLPPATDGKEGFDSSRRLSAPPPYVVSAGKQAPRGAPTTYKGAIDIDEYDGDAAYGYRDRTEGDNEIAPEGNPYNLNRVASPQSAGPCFDDEANDDTIDGDERMNYQARSRNDPTRVDVGIMNRRKDVARYVEEECAEAENREWWGKHEY